MGGGGAQISIILAHYIGEPILTIFRANVNKYTHKINPSVRDSKESERRGASELRKT